MEVAGGCFWWVVVYVGVEGLGCWEVREILRVAVERGDEVWGCLGMPIYWG